ncbi:MAG: GNAT family N-acetyltransferase [Candidatus Lokiarchaeota archaeon]|nr:GNAT family N-acetyltransferase [Candidatus Lokiarchaeota archaeon]
MFYNLEIVEEINDGPLFLRKIKKNDAKFFYTSLNEKNLITYLSLGPLATLEASKRLIRKYLRFWDKYAQYNYVIELRESSIVSIGTINLWNLNWRHERGEVGIWIIPSYWNKGYGEIALNLIKDIGFIHLKLNRLEAHIALENKRSIFLFKKCEFKEEGRLKQYLNFQGIYHDALVLACLKNRKD